MIDFTLGICCLSRDFPADWVASDACAVVFQLCPRDAFDAKVHLSIFFSLEVFRYKIIKMYLTQSTDKRAISSILTVFLLSFYENASAVLTTSMFADR